MWNRDLFKILPVYREDLLLGPFMGAASEEAMNQLTFWAFLEPKVEVKRRLPKTTAPMRIGTCFGNFIIKCEN